MSAHHQLARTLRAVDHDVHGVFDALATSLTASLCDGCAIVLPGSIAIAPVMRHHGHRSDSMLAAIPDVTAPVVLVFDDVQHAAVGLPETYGAYIGRFGLRALAIVPLCHPRLHSGMVIATRDGASDAFDGEELAAIESCVEYASLAADSVLRLDAERAALRAERERTLRFQREILGIIGHDLKAPLGAILVGTEMLADESQGRPAATRVVTRIVSFTNRMTHIVDQLLDITHARLGDGIPLVRSRIHLLPLIRSVVGELARAHPSHHFELAASGDVRGVWDPHRLRQVTACLLSNAVMHGLERAPIVVALSRSGGAVEVTVHNAVRGQPIPAHALESVFEPYHRGCDPEYRGSGLGLDLYIVREIVHAHGGTVTVESSPSGTTFYVVLPDADPAV